LRMTLFQGEAPIDDAAIRLAFEQPRQTRLLRRYPLRPDTDYSLELAVDGRTYRQSFRTEPASGIGALMIADLDPATPGPDRPFRVGALELDPLPSGEYAAL